MNKKTAAEVLKKRRDYAIFAKKKSTASAVLFP